MLTPARISTDELLDEHDAPDTAMKRSLRDLRRFNAFAGGTRAYLALVQRLVRAAGTRDGRDSSFSILDLGTGTSDLLEAVQRRWPRARAIGLDFNVRHLAYGVEIGARGVERVAADAFRLPFRDHSVDVVSSSHFFHHFAPDENAAILRESLRVARVGALVTDTRRHYAPLLFVRLLGALRLIGEITRYDAPASVLQGYTIEEVNDIVRQVLPVAEQSNVRPASGDSCDEDVAEHRNVQPQAQVSRFELHRMIPFRFGLVIWK